MLSGSKTAGVKVEGIEPVFEQARPIAVSGVLEVVQGFDIKETVTIGSDNIITFTDTKLLDNHEALKPSDSYVQSFARGLAVIKTFNAERPAQSLTEVAEATGLTRASARRILLTLLRLGYVQLEAKLFRLTPKILDLGLAYLSSMPFWDLAEPTVEALVEKTRQTSSMAVLDDTDAVIVLRVPVRRVMTLNLSIGSRLPAIYSSMGRVLLADLPEQQLDEVLRTTQLRYGREDKNFDITKLKDTLSDVRKQGWALVDQELEAGLISLAAPIYARNGRVLAALNTSCIIQGTYQSGQIMELIEPLKEAADIITRTITRRT